VVGAGLSILQNHPTLDYLFSMDIDRRLNQEFEQVIMDISKTDLALKLMQVCTLPNLDLEKALTALRSHILFKIFDIESNPSLASVQSALALQCFTNEYIYHTSVYEADALTKLKTIVSDMLINGCQPGPHLVLCIASYEALFECDWHGLLKNNPDIDAVFTRQISEPLEEIRLKSQMPTLKKINDKVSNTVRQQYEKNPYPRWVHTGLRSSPASVSEITRDLKLNLSDTAINYVDAPEILIAGCGTGQHALGTACRFKNSKILAIDLSLSSLAYARRKTSELKINNIDYMQADILDVSHLNQKFDIIESAGVLHHMNDPMEGWKALVSCLKPSGIMKIGLYSELARQHIKQARIEIDQLRLTAELSEIRAHRQTLIASELEHHKLIKTSHDFYSMSTLRDLIFHEQEHQFNLEQIGKCLDKLGLAFCGFEANDIFQSFENSFSEIDAKYDLTKWQLFEQINQRTFAGMYQFWCQKKT
jgi:2-polyprenyl-3-methyl-5-hydroxy-6-metoxy-1,4-benzoquinol methylase